MLTAVSITLTVLESALLTYACPPSGATATSNGPAPTGTVAVTVRVAVSTTLTVFSAVWVR